MCGDVCMAMCAFGVRDHLFVSGETRQSVRVHAVAWQDEMPIP